MGGRAGPAGRHALVVGGGIAGLLAGLALRRRFSRVTIVERDRFPPTPAPRRGAPQGRCLHMLMAEGLRVIEALAPGITAALRRAGAEPFDVGTAGALRLASGWLPRVPAGIEMLACSRALLEHVLHARARAEPGVQLYEGRAVRGLRVADGRVVGARVEGEGEAIGDAELTVVATGARSALPRWWAALGRPAVSETLVESHHSYVSRWYETPAAGGEGWKLLSITPAPGVPWGGAIFAAEGGRWGVVLLVPRGEPVPGSDAALLDACARLVDPRLHAALAGARPLSAIVRHEHTDGRRTWLERVEAWPEGLVVVGDAVCSLDPYFGLGMTACARQVATLAGHAWDEPGAAGALQRALGRVVDVPWRLTTEGAGLDRATLLHRRRMLQAAPRSPEVARRLLRRMHLLDPPEAIDAPEVAALVEAALAGR